MTRLQFGVPLWLLAAGGLAALLFMVARASRVTSDRLTVPTTAVVAVPLSGVSAAYTGGPVGLASVALLLGMGAVALGLRQGDVRWVRSPVWLAVAVFFATSALSLTQAQDVGGGTAVLLGRLRDIVLFAVVLLLLAAVPRLRPVVVATVLLVGGLAGITAFQEFVLANSSELGGLAKVPIAEDLGAATARHAGPLDDVNFWGRLLLLAFPLSLALGAGPSRRTRPWLAVSGGMALGIYLTGSRGALVALAVSIGAWLLLTKPRPTTMLAIGAGAAAVLAVPGVFSRVATLAAVLDPDSVAVVDPSINDRSTVQVVGLAMAEDHPILGVGLGNFLLREPEYQRVTGEFISQGVLAPHNLYIELLAETGILGLAAWLLLVGTAAFVTGRSLVVARRLGAAPEAELSARLSAAVLTALVGWSTASIALHLSDFSALLVIVALGTALDIRARSAFVARSAMVEAQVDPSLINPPTAPATGIRATYLVGCLAVALFAGVQALVLGIAAPQWTATAVATVVPNQPRAAERAYAYDVQSRDQLLPTYAALLRSPGLVLEAGSNVGIDPASLRGMEVLAEARYPAAVVDVTVTSTDRDAAQRLATGIITQVTSWLDESDPLYGLKQDRRIATLREDSPPLGGPLPFAHLTVLCLYLAALELSRATRRRDSAA